MATFAKDPRALEEKLSAFAHRFPVSGRIVHSLAGQYGGVEALVDKLETGGFGEESEMWMRTGKPKSMAPEAVRRIFSEKLDSVALMLGIPRESVEIQAALGIPKFFSSLANDEDDDIGLGYGASSSAKRRRERPVDADRSGKTPS